MVTFYQHFQFNRMMDDSILKRKFAGMGRTLNANLVVLLVAACGLFNPLQASSERYSHLQDTLPPPPPPGPVPSAITGPDTACVGETSVYYMEAILGCSVIWTVNGEVWPSEFGALVITWPAEGIQTLIAYLSCGPGQPLQLMKEVIVNAQPSPIQIWGDTSVCEYTIHFYHTNAGPFDSCIWTVNGEIQPTFTPALLYAFEGAGEYSFNVEVINNCGTGSPSPLQVTAGGSAPPPPGPITGPDTCCTFEEVTYTTEAPPGYPCIWFVDNVLQPDTAEQITVIWTASGSHTVEARTVGGCGTSSPSSLLVTVFTLPMVDLGPDTAIYEGEFIILDAGNPGCEYLWSTGDTTRTIVVDSAGTYSVTASSSCGSDWDDIEVSILVGVLEAVRENTFPAWVIDRKIIIDFHADAVILRIYTINGTQLYNGPLIRSFSVKAPGIYIIRIISPEQDFIRKLFVR